MALKIYFDGGLRPAGMETAVVIRGVAHIREALGPGTSMAAEWLALHHALELTQAAGWGDVILIGDAAAVIDQANGRVRARGEPIAPAAAVHALLATAATRPRIRHVKRAQNLAGIALARRHERG